VYCKTKRRRHCACLCTLIMTLTVQLASYILHFQVMSLRNDGHRWCEYDDPPRNYVPPKHCRECVLEYKNELGKKKCVCAICSEYICPKCASSKNYRTCFECRSNICHTADRWCSSKCDECGRRLCKTCISKTVAFKEEGVYLCHPCRTGLAFGCNEIMEH